MAWFLLIIAGLLEVGWAVGMKYTEGWTRLTPSLLTIGSMMVSFFILTYAVKTLPIGTAYAVWVGIGVVGVAILGAMLFGETLTVGRCLFLTLILTGIIGLKITTTY